MPDNKSSWMSALPFVGGVVNAIGNIGTARKNRRFTREENRRQREWSLQMFDKQNKRDIDFWKMQNSYNDPAAQMSRLKNAGLNPNLVYGRGADATAGPISTHSAPQPNTSPEKAVNAVGGSIFDFLAVEQAKANIARTRAETDATRARTTGTDFQNRLNDLIGLDKMYAKWDWASQKVATDSQRANADWQAYKAGTNNYFGKGSIAAKAAAAGYKFKMQELKNAVSRGDLMESEKIIKTFEANLTKEGFSPNSPWYIKVFGDWLRDSGLSPNDFGRSTGSDYNGLKPYKPNWAK